MKSWRPFFSISALATIHVSSPSLLMYQWRLHLILYYIHWQIPLQSHSFHLLYIAFFLLWLRICRYFYTNHQIGISIFSSPANEFLRLFILLQIFLLVLESFILFTALLIPLTSGIFDSEWCTLDILGWNAKSLRFLSYSMSSLFISAFLVHCDSSAHLFALGPVLTSIHGLKLHNEESLIWFSTSLLNMYSCFSFFQFSESKLSSLLIYLFL